MISEIDINDWEMLTEPLKLKNIEINEFFSIDGSKEVFKHYGNFADAIRASRLHSDKPMLFVLPDFLTVNKWVHK